MVWVLAKVRGMRVLVPVWHDRGGACVSASISVRIGMVTYEIASVYILSDFLCRYVLPCLMECTQEYVTPRHRQAPPPQAGLGPNRRCIDPRTPQHDHYRIHPCPALGQPPMQLEAGAP